jgi:hypothetical protein
MSKKKKIQSNYRRTLGCTGVFYALMFICATITLVTVISGLPDGEVKISGWQLLSMAASSVLVSMVFISGLLAFLSTGMIRSLLFKQADLQARVDRLTPVEPLDQEEIEAVHRALQGDLEQLGQDFDRVAADFPPLGKKAH